VDVLSIKSNKQTAPQGTIGEAKEDRFNAIFMGDHRLGSPFQFRRNGKYNATAQSKPVPFGLVRPADNHNLSEKPT